MTITSVAVYTTPQITRHLNEFQIAVGRQQWGRAATNLSDLRSAITRYNTSRGQLPTAELRILDKLFYWIDREVLPVGKQREVMRLVVDLQKILVVPLPSDPLKALGVVFENLSEAWKMFVLGKTAENADVVDAQLTALLQLEEKFKATPVEIYGQFRKVVELAGSCRSRLYNSISESAEKVRTTTIDKFEALFQAISSLSAPEHYELRVAAPERPRMEVG